MGLTGLVISIVEITVVAVLLFIFIRLLNKFLRRIIKGKIYKKVYYVSCLFYIGVFCVFFFLLLFGKKSFYFYEEAENVYYFLGLSSVVIAYIGYRIRKKTKVVLYYVFTVMHLIMSLYLIFVSNYLMKD